ncbi:MAG: hypothetical protein Q8P46_07590 [Hyphomicrobiales bacterium]|nr:hypothetical protein [Hyphomicrobiales bacterium]
MKRSMTIAAASLLFPIMAGTAVAGSRIEASVTQIGSLNVSFAEERTDINKFKLTQIGRGNTSLVIQRGKQNTANINQLGIVNVSNVFQVTQFNNNEPGPGYLFTYSQNGFNYSVLSMTPMSFNRIGRLR